MKTLYQLLKINNNLKAKYNTKIIPHNNIDNQIKEYKEKISDLENQFFQKQKYIKHNIKSLTTSSIDKYENLLYTKDYFEKLLVKLNFFEDKLKIFSKIHYKMLKTDDLKLLIEYSTNKVNARAINNKYKINEDEQVEYGNDYQSRILSLKYLPYEEKMRRYNKIYNDLLNENNTYEDALMKKGFSYNQLIYEANLDYFESKSLLSLYMNFYNILLVKHENIFVQFKNEELILFCEKDCKKIQEDINHLIFKLNGKFEYYKSVINKNEKETKMLDNIIDKINEFNTSIKVNEPELKRNQQDKSIDLDKEMNLIQEELSFIKYA